jgi:RNA polymerase sigma-70 factor (ECF subfamily)
MVDRMDVSGARPDEEFEERPAGREAGDAADDGPAADALGPEVETSGGAAGRSRTPSGSSKTEAADASRAEDHALVRRAQAGDERAFEGLVRRHQQRAWRVARNLVASDEDAHDLAQEAFLRVFRNLSGFDFQHGFTTWLYRIVTNLAIDLLRKRRTALSTTRTDPDEGDFDLPDMHVERPSEGLERAELAQDVRACLAALAPHFQSVLMLREMEGLPCNEIAHIVGATHVTVRWRLHRGRKLFQEEWERRKRLAQSGPGGASRANSDAAPGVEVDGGKGEGS